MSDEVDQSCFHRIVRQVLSDLMASEQRSGGSKGESPESLKRALHAQREQQV